MKLFYIRTSFQGNIYLHDLIVDENTYSVINFVPDGDYIYRTRISTQHDHKEHMLIEVKQHIQFRATGIN